MLRETGARDQESLRRHPATEKMQQFPFPLTGLITGVVLHDAGQNSARQTLVDIKLQQGYGSLVNVPVSTGKANAIAGEEWTPEIGDRVIVQFIGGMWTRPIVTGYCNVPDNLLQASITEVPAGKRRYHMRCNKTDITIDKTGSRTAKIANNDTIEVENDASLTVKLGDYTITLSKGSLIIDVAENAEITVNGDTTITTTGNLTIDTTGTSDITTKGDATITSNAALDIISTADCTITTSANANVNAVDVDITASGSTSVTSTGTTSVKAKKISLDGGSGTVTGVVTQECKCAFTGKPHSDYSKQVSASKG